MPKLLRLPEGSKTRTLAGHVFSQDGTMLVSDEDGARLERTLVRYYGVTMEDVPEPDVEESEEGSLTKSNTAGT